MGAIIAILAMLAIGAGASSDKKKGTKNTDNKPGDKSIDPVVSNNPPSVVAEPIKNTKPSGVVTTFEDLGSSGSVLTLNSIDKSKTDWPGVRSLPDAWQRGALNLLSTIPYYVAMGKTPQTMPTSADPDRIYRFASELEDAIKAGSVGGLGVNTSLALKELLTTARFLESRRGYESPARWGAAYGFT